MKIKVLYSKSELEATVEFVSIYNKHFIGESSAIRQAILNEIDSLVSRFPNPPFIGTMGFMVEGDVLEVESVDSDENVMFVNFYVNPRLMTNQPHTDEEIDLDTVEEIRII